MAVPSQQDPTNNPQCEPAEGKEPPVADLDGYDGGDSDQWAMELYEVWLGIPPLGPEPPKKKWSQRRRWHRDRARRIAAGRELVAEGQRNREEVRNEAPSSDYDPAKLKSVYFIESPSMNRVKIGIARNADRRLCELLIGSPIDDLRIAAIVPGPRNLEQHLHKRFSKFRLHGEWFEFAEPIRAYLREKVL